MAGFCVTCGAPMTGAFCSKCGAKAVAPGAPPAQIAPPVQAPSPIPAPTRVVVTQPATVAKSSGLGKILLWVGGIFFVLLLVGAGASIYGYYWVKHKVSSYASAITGDSGGPIKVVSNGQNCKLLSTAELQSVLGIPIEKSAEIVEGSDAGCAYYTNSQGMTKLHQMDMEFAKEQADEASKQPGANQKMDNPLALMKNANQLEGAMKTFGFPQDNADGKVFSFTVSQMDEQSWSGMKLVEAAVPGFEEVHGVGDHAMIGAFGHAFYAKKGGNMIHLDTTMVPDARTRGTQIAKIIFQRL